MNIKAKVIKNWDRETHPNCKFLPGNKVKVLDNINIIESNKLKNNIGLEGTVIAVTVAHDNKMRGHSEFGYCNRMYTRYYVQFENGYVGGYHSHYLSLVK
jgi:hypothetical protein